MGVPSCCARTCSGKKYPAKSESLLMLLALSMRPPLNSKSYLASITVNLGACTESCWLRGQEAPARNAHGSDEEQSRGGSTLLPPRSIDASVCADNASRPSRDRL